MSPTTGWAHWLTSSWFLFNSCTWLGTPWGWNQHSTWLTVSSQQILLDQVNEWMNPICVFCLFSLAFLGAIRSSRTHTHRHTHTHTHTDICTHTCTQTYTHTHRHIHTYTHALIHMHTHNLFFTLKWCLCLSVDKNTLNYAETQINFLIIICR